MRSVPRPDPGPETASRSAYEFPLLSGQVETIYHDGAAGLAVSNVLRILTPVVFPAPFGPRKAKISPRETANETLSTATRLLNAMVRFLTTIMCRGGR